MAVLCALLMVLPAGLGASAGQTEASWAGSEYGEGSFTAKTVPPPTVSHPCGVDTVLITLVFTDAWVDFAPPAGYTKDDITWRTGKSTTSLATVTPAVTPNGNAYRAKFSRGLLESVLGALWDALTGSTFYIEARTMDGTWTSESRYSKVDTGLLGLNSSCTDNVTP
ncbi:hypothetical protein [Raineyella sp. LH-20]|uniref:hypothetical protein n=1 Tax=Raineyella sp. LH-20 TaxID=3081204 RepID=UPI002952E836|nr:hypothetical protein [Raineyella sp. LH-20]WOP19810.1 hypothetical protein R0146_05935 [Raineyella sp. LH-20]